MNCLTALLLIVGLSSADILLRETQREGDWRRERERELELQLERFIVSNTWGVCTRGEQ